jgi:integral membrane sensor domain MASE1
MKIRMAIAGALIAPFVGFIGMFLLCVFGDIPYHGCGVSFLGFCH